MTVRPLVLIDTNVVLIGALSPLSNATELTTLQDKARFVTTRSILDEASKVIASCAPSASVTKVAEARIRSYLSDLNASVLPTASSEVTEHDEHVRAAFRTHGCDLICTYNIRDFQGMRALTPLGIHKELDFQGAAIEYPVLGEDGTLLIEYRYHGDRTMGRILGAQNGTEVLSPKPGEIHLLGNGVTFKTHNRIPEGHAHFVVIRYRATGEIEAAAWPSKPSGPGRQIQTGMSGKLLLMTGTASLPPPVRPLMFFGKNYGFDGQLFGLSGVPTFVRDRRIRHVLEVGTLEVATKSEDISALLNDIKVFTDPSGREIVAMNIRERRTRTV